MFYHTSKNRSSESSLDTSEKPIKKIQRSVLSLIPSFILSVPIIEPLIQPHKILPEECQLLVGKGYQGILH